MSNLKYDSDIFAIFSFVLSLIAIVTCCYNLFGLLFGIISIILGIISILNPYCKRKIFAFIGMVISLIIILINIIVVIVFIIFPLIDDSTLDITKNENEMENNIKNNSIDENIFYLETTALEMLTDLDDNALNAKNKYYEKYVCFTGYINEIDINGKTIEVSPRRDDYYFDDILCYIQNIEQEEYIEKLKKGDIVKIYGKCSNISEIFGYSVICHKIQKY